jgi:7-cyano-7-deazaguanine reductase
LLFAANNLSFSLSFQRRTETIASINLPLGEVGQHLRLIPSDVFLDAGTGRRMLVREVLETREPTRFSFTRYNIAMPKQRAYTPEHAAAGLNAEFPEIETWPNQFPGYEIVIDDPEFTSVCPKTGLPDFGVITLRYQPDKLCLELKSYKEYLHGYRNLGIFQENVVNRVLEDVVRWAKPVWAEVKGEFRPRGGISTTVVARWPRGKNRDAG